MLETRPASAWLHTDATGQWICRAPAKLNLGLRVFPPRPDGFHDLESWMVPLSWHDTLRFRPGGPLRLTIRGRTPGIPTDLDKNLVGRAALRLAREAGLEPHGTLELHKLVPPGGGLGGGSSDAANALLLLNRAWGCHLELAHILAIAAELGSDVPFFVHGRPALCKGRGEIMTPLRLCHPLFAVLLLPDQGIATKPVYQAFDAGHRHHGLPATDWAACAAMTARDLNDVLVNDLEPAAMAFAPWLKQLQSTAARTLQRKVHMTGSGSTLFTLCATAPEAIDVADRLRTGLGGLAQYIPVRVLQQRSTGHGVEPCESPKSASS